MEKADVSNQPVPWHARLVDGPQTGSPKVRIDFDSDPLHAFIHYCRKAGNCAIPTALYSVPLIRTRARHTPRAPGQGHSH